MKISYIIEREDGGADVGIEDLSPHEVKALIAAGFVKLIEEAAKREEEQKKLPALLRSGKNEENST